MATVRVTRRMTARQMDRTKEEEQTTLDESRPSSSPSSGANSQNYTNMPVKCQLCPEVILGMYKLNKHLARVHKAKIVMRCKLCGKKFRRNKDMVRHLRETHMEEQSSSSQGLNNASPTKKKKAKKLKRLKERPEKDPVSSKKVGYDKGDECEGVVADAFKVSQTNLENDISHQPETDTYHSVWDDDDDGNAYSPGVPSPPLENIVDQQDTWDSPTATEKSTFAETSASVKDKHIVVVNNNNGKNTIAAENKLLDKAVVVETSTPGKSLIEDRGTFFVPAIVNNEAVLKPFTVKLLVDGTKSKTPPATASTPTDTTQDFYSKIVTPGRPSILRPLRPMVVPAAAAPASTQTINVQGDTSVTEPSRTSPLRPILSKPSLTTTCVLKEGRTRVSGTLRSDIETHQSRPASDDDENPSVIAVVTPQQKSKPAVDVIDISKSPPRPSTSESIENPNAALGGRRKQVLSTRTLETRPKLADVIIIDMDIPNSTPQPTTRKSVESEAENASSSRGERGKRVATSKSADIIIHTVIPAKSPPRPATIIKFVESGAKPPSASREGRRKQVLSIRTLETRPAYSQPAYSKPAYSQPATSKSAYSQGERELEEAILTSIDSSSFVEPKRIMFRVRTSTTSESPCYDCVACGSSSSSFPTKQAVKVHFASHHPDLLPYKCENNAPCSRAFMSEEALQAHLRSHTTSADAAPVLRRKEHVRSECDITRNIACRICDKIIGRDNYGRHLTRHRKGSITPGKYVACPLCTHYYKIPFLVCHMYKVHYRKVKDEIVVCPLCDDEVSATSLIPHYKSHRVPREKLICSQCGASYNYENSLKKHTIFAHPHPDRDITCRSCLKEFETKELTEQHQVEAHGRICELCGFSCRNTSDLTQHLLIHGAESGTRQRSWICEECGWGSFSRGDHIVHKYTHQREKPFQCEFCDFGYVQKAMYKLHLLKFHLGPDGFRPNEKEGKPNTFVCEVCMEAYPNEACLNYHLQYHKGERPFPCIECLESFHTEYDLMYHKHQNHYVLKQRRYPVMMKDQISSDVVEQTPDKSEYTCKTCDKKFGIKALAVLHWRVKHMDEKPFPCKVCGKGFRHPGDVTYHVRSVHTKEPVAACSTCGMNFYSKSNWRVHMKTHDKKLPCSRCQQVFTTVGLYRAHVKSKTCGEEYGNEGDYCMDLI